MKVTNSYGVPACQVGMASGTRDGFLGAALRAGPDRRVGWRVFATHGQTDAFAHPRIVATAHTASLTSDYFAAASRRLGDALAAYFIHQPPAGLLSTPNHAISPIQLDTYRSYPESEIERNT